MAFVAGHGAGDAPEGAAELAGLVAGNQPAPPERPRLICDDRHVAGDPPPHGSGRVWPEATAAVGDQQRARPLSAPYGLDRQVVVDPAVGEAEPRHQPVVLRAVGEAAAGQLAGAKAEHEGREDRREA